VVERARVFAGFSEDELTHLMLALERIDNNVRAMLVGEGQQ
jgi:hypothetical protein